MKSFLNNLVRSVWGPEFYEEQLHNPRGASAHFILLSGLFALFITVGFMSALVPAASPYVSSARSYLLAAYPNDLEINFDGSKISINQPEPYAVPFPSSWIKSDQASTSIVNAVTFNTQQPFSVGAFESSRSMAYVASDSIATYKEYDSKRGIGTEIQMVSMSSVACTGKPDCEPFTVTETKVAEFIDGVLPYVPYVMVFGGVFVFLFIWIIQLFGILSLLIIALFVWLLVKFIAKQQLTYGTALSLTVYAATLPFIIGVALAWGPQLFGLESPFVFGVTSTGPLTLLIVLVNLRVRG